VAGRDDRPPSFRGRWAMLAVVDRYVLVAAVLLVAAPLTLILRSEWAAAGTGRGAALERLWVLLPIAFLVVLVVLVARVA
jgi:hypothetical protein